MPKQKVATSFGSLPDNELVNKAMNVDKGMTGNTNFPNPDPPLVDLRNYTAVFSAATANSGNNTKEDTAAKKLAKANLISFLDALALYVQANCKNDPAIILSSGFDLQKNKTPVGPLPKPQNLRAKNVDGIEGSVKLMVTPVPKATGYLWQYAETPITDVSIWHASVGSAAAITLAVKNRTEYTFRVAATGSDPTQTFSDKLTFFVV